jgi:hypothetical protein
MGLHHSPLIATNGLILCLDAINTRSYSGTGTTWADLSGNAFNGTIQNSPAYNSAGYFSFTNASTGIITFSSIPQLQFLGRSQYTLECWIRVTTIPGNLTYRRIIHRESNPGIGRDGYNFWIESSVDGTNITFASERFVAGIQSGVNITVPYATNGNGWNQWSITYDGLNLRMYRNGSLVSGPVSDTRNITNNTAVLSLASQGGPNSIGGDFASIKVYNVALSASDVRQNFNALRARYGV